MMSYKAKSIHSQDIYLQPFPRGGVWAEDARKTKCMR